MTTDFDLYPNTFQCPNLYADKLAYFLTPEENLVLTKAVREIMGFHAKDRTRRIALSVFIDGKVAANGERLCYGCGLGKSTIIKALAALDKFGVLVKVGPATHQEGQAYQLQLSSKQIDWAGLEKRRNEKDKKAKKRLEAARAVNPIIDSSSCATGKAARPVRQTAARPVRQTHGNQHRNQQETNNIAQVVVEIFSSLGIDSPVHAELASLPHVTEQYLKRWLKYHEAQARKPGGGYYVLAIREGRKPPAGGTNGAAAPKLTPEQAEAVRVLAAADERHNGIQSAAEILGGLL